jgi:hypothetical protein
LLDYIIWVAGQVAALPGANQQVDFGIWPFVIAMAVIAAVIIYMRHKTHHNWRDDNIVE